MTTSNKSNSPRVQQNEAPVPSATLDTNENADSECVIRFASNDKPLGRTISYVIKQLRDTTRPVVLQGSGLAMTKVVTVAGIARDRVGDIHQLCEFLNITSQREGGSDTTGIQITLSSKEADAQAMKAIGYGEPLKKGFMLADMSESDRKRFQTKRKPSSAKNVKNDKNEKVDDVKNDKVVKAVTGSPKQQDTSAKPSKRRQYREKKPFNDDKKPEVIEAKNDVAAADENQKKRKQKHRNNKKATADENQPPASSAKSDIKTPSAAEKKEVVDQHYARKDRPQNDEKFFTRGSGMRRGAPRGNYNNYAQGRYYDYQPHGYNASPHPGYFGSPNGFNASPAGANGYQRSPYGNNRGGNNHRGNDHGGNPRQMYPRYQMAYPETQGRRGGFGYQRNGPVVGDLSGSMAYQRSNASYRDEVLEQSTIKREVGTRQNLQNH